MATFSANIHEEDPQWYERQAVENFGFRIWHLMFFCLIGSITLLVLIFCCVKIRIPRTKQEIEADYRRKKLASKFRERLKLIQNQDMDEMDLQRALEIIQEDYKRMKRDIDEQIAIDMCAHDLGRNKDSMKAEPQQPTSFARRITNIVKATKMKPQMIANN